MNLYDEHYSAYFAAPDEDYPSGSAVDSTSEDRLDGTPFLAAFFNDIVGFFQAAFYGVFGNPKVPGETVTRSPSNTPENARRSDVWDAIKKFVVDRVDEVRAMIGIAGGIAPLDSGGKVPANHLPSYVDDVLEFPSLGSFPATGEDGKIYVALDTDKEYRWSGTGYRELSKYDIMSGASASADGVSGLVPPPKAGDQNRFLAGDGKWREPATEAVFNLVWPVGVTYTQYPGKKSPQELFAGTGSTWEIVTEYGGAFFRAEGGNAAAFIEAGRTLTMQAQATAVNGLSASFSGSSSSATLTGGNHDHTMHGKGEVPGWGYITNKSDNMSGGGEAHFGVRKTYPDSDMRTGDSGDLTFTATFTAKGSVSLKSSQAETRPGNYTYRIWLRTA